MKHIANFLISLSLAVPAIAAASFDKATAAYAGKDYVGAREIAEPLAKNGDVPAMAMLGSLYQKGQGVAVSLDTAMGWYEKAAVAGDAPSQFALAMIYLDGSL